MADMSTDAPLLLLPRPATCAASGQDAWRLPADLPLRLGREAAGVGGILQNQWRDEGFPAKLIESQPLAAAYSFTLGQPTDSGTPSPPEHPEAYALQITATGVTARANAHAGLLYAWQTLKQILRHASNTACAPANAVPCLTITDQPALDWRVYHLDLKGTRRRLDNLYALLPRLAELKINAVLAEYEDHVQLERRPELAHPDAITKDQLRDWIAEARRWNVHVVPLVQTLGHLQYVLIRPEYAHLRQNPDSINDAAPGHPETWRLVTDFLDEMTELHPDAPFLHAGLDEAHSVEHAAFVEWFNRICEAVSDRGLRPMAWADMLTSKLDKRLADKLPKDVILADWLYSEVGPTQEVVSRFEGRRVSREHLRRPDAPTTTPPRMNFGEGVSFIEDLPADRLAELGKYAAVEESPFPQQVRTLIGQRMLADLGLPTIGACGLRVSFHGPFAPRYITGQLNAIAWANACIETHAIGLIGTSWSRGHTLAGINAHPELDWYATASMAEATWHGLTTDELRDFDHRFAFQWFGLPDGEIGDLLFLHEATTPRVDHTREDYLPHILARLAALRPSVVRNADAFALIQATTEALAMRHRVQFALLEHAYFFGTWDRQPDSLKARLRDTLNSLVAECDSEMDRLAGLYSQALIERDARELAMTQLGFDQQQARLNAAGL